MNNDSHQITGKFYDIEIFNRLVRVRANGVWDAETTSVFIKELKQTITDLGPGAWGVYFDLRGWGLAVPEAQEYLEELGEWTAPQGAGDHIFLLDGDSIQEALVSRILSISSHDSRFFTDAEECRKWLNDNAPGHTDYETVLKPLDTAED